ncbi:MAG: hypothetical protein HUJ68_05255 [Clostridia bacterium]|nr:hypothetical protein [Clostridia bacterium]
MPDIKCQCGNIYDDGFKFCPECATPNPSLRNNSSPKKIGKFTKVGDNTSSVSVLSQSTATIVRNTPPKKSEPVEDYYEDEEDLEEVTEEPSEDNEYFEDSEYVDDESNTEEYEQDEYYEDEYEDDDEDEEPQVTVTEYKPSKAKTLSAPSPKKTDYSTQRKSVKNELPKTKSSLAKKPSSYDPNYDGYYDDRLPALLDEVTKTSHIDVILKIALSIACIAALITYCIFYLQV